MTKFAPTPARRSTLGGLELSRFVAATMVVLFHVPRMLDRYAATPADRILLHHQTPGPMAVQWFFVLSGFVLYTAHRRDFGRAQAVPLFFYRRLLRIYPLYLVALTV